MAAYELGACSVADVFCAGGVEWWDGGDEECDWEVLMAVISGKKGLGRTVKESGNGGELHISVDENLKERVLE